MIAPGPASALVGLCIALLPAYAAFAQVAPEDRGELPPIAPSIASPSRATTEPSLRLSISGLPEGFDLRRPVPSSYRDGHLIARVDGTIQRTNAEDFVFLPDAGSQTIDSGNASALVPPMVLLPCQKLAQIASGVAARTAQGEDGVRTSVAVRASLSGLLYVYRGRAFVLPTSVVFRTDAPTTAPTTSPTPASPTPPAPTQPDAGTNTADNTAPDASLANVVRDLEQAWSTRRTLARPERIADRELDNPSREASTSGPEDDAPPLLLPERTLLSQTKGRLVRLTEADGRFAFALDNDPNSPNPAAIPEPLLLLPSRQLEQIEQAFSQLGDNASFTLTGRVFEYRGHRYLMPIAFRVLPATPPEIKPAQ